MKGINEEIEDGNGLNPNLKFLRTSDFRIIPQRCLTTSDRRSSIEKQKIIKKYAEKAEKGLPLFEEQKS